MNQPQLITGTSSAIPAEPGLPLIHVIERAMRDPTLPIERVDAFVAHYSRERDEYRSQMFSRAMAAAQAEIRQVIRDQENPQTKSRYASYAALDGAVRPAYSKHGLSVSYNTDLSPRGEGWLRIIMTVEHDAGGSRIFVRDMPIITKGPRGQDVMTQIHATASAETYGKRYALAGAFNIAAEEDDDDGNAAGVPEERITPEQVELLTDLLNESGADPALFLKKAHADRIEAMASFRFADAENFLRMIISRKKVDATAHR
jgi:hypothetical protein